MCVNYYFGKCKNYKNNKGDKVCNFVEIMLYECWKNKQYYVVIVGKVILWGIFCGNREQFVDVVNIGKS